MSDKVYRIMWREAFGPEREQLYRTIGHVKAALLHSAKNPTHYPRPIRVDEAEVEWREYPIYVEFETVERVYVVGEQK